MKKQTHTKQKGFTLLFAVLISILVMSISTTIISISTRQIILSGTSRESQYAFYAANTALECAYYWDQRGDNFDDNKFAFPLASGSSTSETLECAGGNIKTGDGFSSTPGNTFNRAWLTPIFSIDESEHTFWMVIENKSSSGITINTPRTCAKVTVFKEVGQITVAGIDYDQLKTKIEARGYNTCDLSDSRTVERGVEIEY